MPTVAKWIIELGVENADNWEHVESKLQGLEDILQAAVNALGMDIYDFEQK